MERKNEVQQRFFLFIKPDAAKVHGGGNAESELLKRKVQDQHWGNAS